MEISVEAWKLPRKLLPWKRLWKFPAFSWKHVKANMEEISVEASVKAFIDFHEKNNSAGDRADSYLPGTWYMSLDVVCGTVIPPDGSHRNSIFRFF